MWTQITEAYNFYKIYTQINNLVRYDDEINNEDLQEIKDRVLNGGCTTIKFAQWIISRLRSEQNINITLLVDYFDDIFEDCPEHSLEYTNQIYRKDWEDRLNFLPMSPHLDDLIYEDTLKVLASGSVGQIYYAKLKNPYILCQKCDRFGHKFKDTSVDILNSQWSNLCPFCNSDNLTEVSEVAIKVKHPGINEDIENKKKLFGWLYWLQKIQWVKNKLHLHMNFNDFIDNMNKQIDFREELYNNHKFRNNFRGNDCVYFPMVFEGSSNIIITEFVQAQEMNKISEFNQFKTTLNFACFVTKMIVNDNFIHGDLHHKNWKVRMITQNKPQIVVFDCGICFQAEDKEFGIKIWEGFENNDIQVFIDNIDMLIEGEYSPNVKEYVTNILKKYINDSYDLICILNEFNSLLSEFNCRLSSLILNYVLLLCVIDATLKKHNLIGKIKTDYSSTPETNSLSSSLEGSLTETPLSDIEENGDELTTDGERNELTTDGSGCELTESEDEFMENNNSNNNSNNNNNINNNIEKKYQHYNIIKSKMMDLLAFIDSRDTYQDTRKYLEDKNKRYNNHIESNVLFFGADYNHLYLEPPE